MFIHICLVLQNIKLQNLMLQKYASLALSIFFLRLKYACKLSVRPYLYCIHTLLYDKVSFFVAFAIFCSVMEKIVMFDVSV
jgi:hypothetical protein